MFSYDILLSIFTDLTTHQVVLIFYLETSTFFLPSAICWNLSAFLFVTKEAVNHRDWYLGQEETFFSAPIALLLSLA